MSVESARRAILEKRNALHIWTDVDRPFEARVGRHNAFAFAKAFKENVHLGISTWYQEKDGHLLIGDLVVAPLAVFPKKSTWQTMADIVSDLLLSRQHCLDTNKPIKEQVPSQIQEIIYGAISSIFQKNDE
jgi:hypothetical protein